MNFPCLGSHLAIWLEGSKAASVISWTLCLSLSAFSAEMIGANELSMKWMRGYLQTSKKKEGKCWQVLGKVNRLSFLLRTRQSLVHLFRFFRGLKIER